MLYVLPSDRETHSRHVTDDELIATTSNGGTVTLNFALLELRADQKLSEFDAPVLSVAIPQSLRMTVSRETVRVAATQAAVSGNSVGLLGLLQRCAGNRDATVIVMLALLIVAVSIYSLASNSLMLCALSLALAAYSVSVVLVKGPTSTSPSSLGASYNIKIRGAHPS
jgi:hypothetical protein